MAIRTLSPSKEADEVGRPAASRKFRAASRRRAKTIGWAERRPEPERAISEREGPASWGIALLVILLGAAIAADEAAAPEPAPAEPAPPVAYDALFRLPNDSSSQPAQGATVDRKRWEDRFAAVRGDLDGAHAKLAKAQADLEALAHKSDSWQMAAPGAKATSENSPVSYKLRQEIRQYREDVGRAERRLRELEVEASLAGVPPEWRQPAHVDAAPAPAPGS